MSGAPDPLVRVAPVLRCPNCGGPLEVDAGGARCGAGHRFDRARQGHLTLFGPRGRRFPGDTAEQVASRERLLGSGLFDPVADAVSGSVAGIVGGSADRVVLDCGAGTGFYLSRVLDRLGPSAAGLGTEISAPAARRLARAHPAAAAVVADTWEPWPVADGALDAVTVVFAPRNVAEFARVLRPAGALVVAVPGDGHLEPLRSRVGMLTPAEGKSERLSDSLGHGFAPVGVVEIDHVATVEPATALDLALMGPSGVHLERGAVASVIGADPAEVRVHVEVHGYLRAG